MRTLIVGLFLLLLMFSSAVFGATCILAAVGDAIPFTHGVIGGLLGLGCIFMAGSGLERLT